MIKSVVDYLERTAARYGDKKAYIDENREVTFRELQEDTRKIATGLLAEVTIGTPVLVYMDKCVECIEGFLGVSYTGAFYVPIDTAMPYPRVKLIMDTLGAEAVLTRRADEIPEEIKEICKVFYVEDLLQIQEIDTEELAKRNRKRIDTDPIYAIFTSGSTGVPKGVLVSQRSVINFTEWWCETFGFTEEEVFANQTPFYFDASVKDIYATLRCGATMYIVPKKLFSLPAQLVRFLNEKKINCIDWVPSVLCMIANFRTFEKVKPEYLKKVMFLGEVMPTKQFNIWRRALPEVKYANLYGPTEATGDCTYYKIEREFADDEPIPIGFACENTEVLLLNEENRPAAEGETGEICVRGCSLALGYYNNQEKTDEVFVVNPLQKNYRERIYRTGDLGKYNRYGEIVFLARKDSQIKHMGHRIELGEIETAISSLEQVDRICCLFDRESQKIIAVYTGGIDAKEMTAQLKEKLPRYMLPNLYQKLDEMPINLNGKIDRTALQKEFIGAKENG
ncbi:MAG: amino acid adenylation domain-containing protein [Bacteroidales bacterium]|nr:amino acid adenylation domain-containing protein [Bacteroidales bacterium]MCM1416738.1 amino acid adenylation domain-containing protein [bacterium]MCM1424755.1 amino acid adenylation domain-containing protein [bacterium]